MGGGHGAARGSPRAGGFAGDGLAIGLLGIAIAALGMIRLFSQEAAAALAEPSSR